MAAGSLLDSRSDMAVAGILGHTSLTNAGTAHQGTTELFARYLHGG